MLRLLSCLSSRVRRFVPVASGMVLVALGSPSSTQAQGGGAPPSGHGAMVMGFDQDSAVHHFHLYVDGGRIEVVAKHATDGKTRDEIRMHLRHLAGMFAGGDFSDPTLVHEPEHVPGTTVLSTRRAAIRYAYHDVPSGGRVDITTRDAAALTALHEFLKYQIAAHHTGDSLVPTRR